MLRADAFRIPPRRPPIGFSMMLDKKRVSRFVYANRARRRSAASSASGSTIIVCSSAIPLPSDPVISAGNVRATVANLEKRGRTE